MFLEGSFEVVARYITFREKWGGEKGSDFGVQCYTWHRFIICCGQSASSRGSTATFFITISCSQNSCIFSFFDVPGAWRSVIKKSDVNFIVSLLNSAHLIVQLPVNSSWEARRGVRYPPVRHVCAIWSSKLALVTSNSHVELSGLLPAAQFSGTQKSPIIPTYPSQCASHPWTLQVHILISVSHGKYGAGRFSRFQIFEKKRNRFEEWLFHRIWSTIKIMTLSIFDAFTAIWLVWASTFFFVRMWMLLKFERLSGKFKKFLDASIEPKMITSLFDFIQTAP